MEEDEEELKYELLPWVLGCKWRRTYSSLLCIHDEIFWKLDCRAVVSRKCCEQVMEMAPQHWAWQRERPYYHGGARREYCRHPSDNGYPRGPNRSPLQCQKCLEQKCLDSDNSYLIYASDPEISSIEHSSDGGENMDSGFVTLVDNQFDVSKCDLHATTCSDHQCHAPSAVSQSENEVSTLSEKRQKLDFSAVDASSNRDVKLAHKSISENDYSYREEEILFS